MRIRILLSCLATVLILSFAFATETTTEGELLWQRLRAGDVQGARSGYVAALTNSLHQLQHPDPIPPGTTPAAWQDHLLTRLTWDLDWIELAEAHIRLSGAETPDAQLALIRDAAQAVAEAAGKLNDQRSTITTDHEKVELSRSLLRAARVLLETVLFLDGTPYSSSREGLFRAATSYVVVPCGFSEFPTHYPTLDSIRTARFSTVDAPLTQKEDRRLSSTKRLRLSATRVRHSLNANVRRDR
jgi:hypothetical protein